MNFPNFSLISINKVRDCFANKEITRDDFYVADYSNTSPSRGVEIFNEPPSDIEAIHFSNPGIEVVIANMEHNPFFCKREDGSPSKQCECICASLSSEVSRHWVALVELKYCSEKNIPSSFDGAINQLKEHHTLLKDVKKVLNAEQNIYWVISMPKHRDKSPFSGFRIGQSDLLEIKEKYDGATVLPYNEIQIVNGEYLVGKTK